MPARTPIVEFLATTSIGEKGQLTVPKQFRDDLGLKPGAPVTVLRMGDGLILIPEQDRVNRICERITELLLSTGATPESMVETLPEVRKKLYAKRYGASRPVESPKRVSQSRKAK